VAASAAVLAALVWIAGSWQANRSPQPATALAYSVAVLPFDDLSSEQDQGHFSDGVSEEILNRLSGSRSLRVIARKSSFSFRGQSISIPQIAEKLHVTHVLEGSVRKSGNRIRITARLVDAASNAQAWSRTYDRELGDLFAVQDEIATEVAEALDATLASRREYVPKPEAHNLFLEGELFYNRRGPGDIELAVKYYREALALDPAYARAWASLAGAYSLLAYNGGMPRNEALARQGEAARKAIDLDPGLAVAYARLAQYFWDIGDRPSSYRIFDQAKEHDPNDLVVLTFAAGIAMRADKVPEAIAGYDRIVALDPRSAASHANRGIYLQAADRFEEAKAELASARELSPELAAEFDLATLRILVFQGRTREAEALEGRLPEGALRDHALALLRHAEGREADAAAALARLAENARRPVDVRLAETYAYLGMPDQAFEALRGVAEAVEQNDGAVASQLWSWQVEMRVSPFLRTLHDDPRWQELMVEPLAVSS
jgi:TolB-like protein/Tfp pilus assembly protein PilF